MSKAPAITRPILERYTTRPKASLFDPCLICGGKLPVSKWDPETNTRGWYEGHDPSKGETCDHLDDLPDLIARIEKLNPEERTEILEGQQA